jgi:hypothetical protein
VPSTLTATNHAATSATRLVAGQTPTPANRWLAGMRWRVERTRQVEWMLQIEPTHQAKPTHQVQRACQTEPTDQVQRVRQIVGAPLLVGSPSAIGAQLRHTERIRRHTGTTPLDSTTLTASLLHSARSVAPKRARAGENRGRPMTTLANLGAPRSAAGPQLQYAGRIHQAHDRIAARQAAVRGEPAPGLHRPRAPETGKSRGHPTATLATADLGTPPNTTTLQPQRVEQIHQPAGTPPPAKPAFTASPPQNTGRTTRKHQKPARAEAAG